MARYAIGDIQGCYEQFIKLIKKIDFNPSTDTLYLVGDLINRGPESLKVLEWVYKHQDSLVTVLGNHDIYLLARYANIRKPDEDETIKDILTSPNCNKLIDWLKAQPLIFTDNDYILVHAGIYPKLNFNHTLKLAEDISEHLKAKDNSWFLDKVFGNKPHLWSDDLEHILQMKFILNTCTRMRFLNATNYSLDYKYKGELANKPLHLIPWFKVEFDPTINKKILFGHWAALGFYHDKNFISLDTGCVWGRKLTALNLENFELAQV